MAPAPRAYSPDGSASPAAVPAGLGLARGYLSSLSAELRTERIVKIVLSVIYDFDHIYSTLRGSPYKLNAGSVYKSLKLCSQIASLPLGYNNPALIRAASNPAFFQAMVNRPALGA